MIPRRAFLMTGAAACISLSLAAATGELEHFPKSTGHHTNMQNVHKTHTLVKSYSLGKQDGTDIMAYFYQQRSMGGNSLAKRSVEPSECDGDSDALPPSATLQSNQTVIDMSPDLTTPPKCTSVNCYPGAFEAPNKMDCDAIAARQLSQSLEKSKLVATPGSFNTVVFRTCVVVFQNPSFNSNYVLEYKWSFLGNVILLLEKQCFREQAMSIGGACRFSEFQHYKFQNVLISLQRMIESSPVGQ